ncbi:MAG TPA: fused MFS/spermidine synthase [Gemmatales bacterium]|nr:fused MFS/spermidine synthase [Gemmatales bacterium]
MLAHRSLIYLAFFLSGASGLIFQTVWIRMLTRSLGATTHAVATVLAVFMAGLALGSWLGGKWADRSRRPLALYAGLEIAIALVGLAASFAVIDLLGSLYVTWARPVVDEPNALLLRRLAIVVACLLPPTILMGATLPVLTALMSRLGMHFQTGLGSVYAVNTFGAVAGVLATGLVLLGELGETWSLITAGTLNVAAVVVLLPLLRPQPATGPAASPTPTTNPEAARDAVPMLEPYSLSRRSLALIAFFVSGFSALALEVLWSRQLVLLLETSIYAFSVMLGTFLLGIAWGSSQSARSTSMKERPLAGFGLLEIIIGGWSALGLLALPWLHELWLLAGGARQEPVIAMPLTIGALGCLVMVLPIALAFGWQFPLAVRCCLSDARRPGGETGRAYLVNTIGAVAGSVAAGFLLIPTIGVFRTMICLAVINVGLGAFLLAAAPRRERTFWSQFLMVAVPFLLLAAALRGDPYTRIMVQRVQAMHDSTWVVMKTIESSTATTTAAGSQVHQRDRALLVNGVGMTHLCTETKLMAHLPLALAPEPKRMLVLCFGMGTTVRSASAYPRLHIDAVDIVPEVFDLFGYFHADGPKIAALPQVHFQRNDARNHLLLHEEPYDVITMDPAPPLHSAGTVNLYTTEFFELCKQRLTSEGVFCLWLPPAAETESLFILRAFARVFPEGSLWAAWDVPGFYLMGGRRPIQPTPDELDRLAHRLAPIPDLAEWDRTYTQPEKLRGLYLAPMSAVIARIGAVPAVTDQHPYTEFPLWRQLFHPQGLARFDANRVRPWFVPEGPTAPPSTAAPAPGGPAAPAPAATPPHSNQLEPRP